MPIYEYSCTDCRHRFEHLVLSSSVAANCPACGSLNLEQLVSSVAVRLVSTTQANLSAEHHRVAAVRGERLREEHRQHHEHFEDRPASSNHTPENG